MIGRVFRPARLDDLWDLLDDGAVVMAGGTDWTISINVFSR